MDYFADTLKELAACADSFSADAERLNAIVLQLEMEAHRQCARSVRSFVNGSSLPPATLDGYLASLNSRTPNWRKSARLEALSLHKVLEPHRQAHRSSAGDVDADLRAVFHLVALARQTAALLSRARGFSNLPLSRHEQWQALTTIVESWGREAEVAITRLDPRQSAGDIRELSSESLSEMCLCAERIARDTAKFCIQLYDLRSYLRERMMKTSREWKRVNDDLGAVLKDRIAALSSAGEEHEVAGFIELLRTERREAGQLEAIEEMVLGDNERLGRIKKLFSESAEITYRASLLKDLTMHPSFSSVKRVFTHWSQRH